ncbi:MAG TPA: peptidylprolyl isomerase [Methanothermococcus okinawensis]|uniref:Peptidyl-prolyl cis-trans isomerase n=1 Tax=Methanothermococcus okinawensis TaxID=155863 RepID=A0A832YTQ9_9EURY|nr:peptidylprolyl isomerase [Methanothermococcus okinawensis]
MLSFKNKLRYILAACSLLLLISLSGCVSSVSEGPVVKNGSTVSINYIGMFKNGTVFDTSIKSVAEKYGIYNPNREYKPINFTVGAGQVIKGLERGVLGMHVGENKIIEIPPEEAYGPIREDLIIPIPIEYFIKANITPVVGSYVYVRGQPAKIVKVNNTHVVLDFNSPMAGKTLIFNITVVDIKN